MLLLLLEPASCSLQRRLTVVETVPTIFSILELRTVAEWFGIVPSDSVFYQSMTALIFSGRASQQKFRHPRVFTQKSRITFMSTRSLSLDSPKEIKNSPGILDFVIDSGGTMINGHRLFSFRMRSWEIAKSNI